MAAPPTQPLAAVGGLVGTDLQEVSDDPAALDAGGRWVVLLTFEGHATLARFGSWERRELRPRELGRWAGVPAEAWASSMSRSDYCRAVAAVREHIARGEVYQANICRVLRAPLAPEADIAALHVLLAAGNPAPFSGVLRLPAHGVHVACASPELYLGRDGDRLESRPIKGTGATATDLLPKDEAENVMIVDLVRNDLGRVCRTGSVWVPSLLAVEPHPGLVHLVSTVAGHLEERSGWPEILAATFPPGSVTGAPKVAALEIIDAQESGARGPYCGAFGWVDADARTAVLAVAIRTFWAEGEGPTRRLAFGTGAGITWASDSEREWRETELKAAHLLSVAGEEWP